MTTHPASPKTLPLRVGKRAGFALLLSLTALPGCLATDLVGRPAEPPPTVCRSASPTSETPGASLTLAQCLHLALQRQPRIAAARASLAAAQETNHALEMLRVPIILAPELPVRRQQSALGLTAAAAGLDQTERAAVYAVTRTWFTVLFAREQERVARGVVERLTATRTAVQGMLKGGARDISTTDENRTLVYLRLAQTKQTEAEEGVNRALIALREAIGAGPECRLEVSADRLPRPQRRPSHDAVVAWALARRGELIQARILVEVTRLEIEAQATTLRPRMQTFTAGTDLHSRQVPQEVSNSEYRPGAVAPEMPAMLTGSRKQRVTEAMTFHARSQAVAEVTKNLIALEAEDAFLRWRQAERQSQQAREATEAGDKMADDLDKDFTSGLKVRVDEVVTARVTAAQARAQLNEFLFHQILALADLERVTAGAFCAGLVEAAAAQP